jgi:iron complex transport system substrate-binding protein
MEFLIAGKVDVFIGTASGGIKDFESGKASIMLGSGIDRGLAYRSLERAATQPGMEALPAVQSRRVHGIWHDFYNSPHNIVVLENFAKWLHPELFADLDPEGTLAELHRRFSPFDLSGTYAISLEGR